MDEQTATPTASLEERMAAALGDQPTAFGATNEPETAPVEAEATDETPDEASPSADETPDQPDGTEGADNLVEVEFEGKLLKVEPTIKDALMRQADYTRKTMELAEHRKMFQQQQIGPREVTLTGIQITPEQGYLVAPSRNRDAGRSKGRKVNDDRRRFLVQIDEEEFEVSSQEEAEIILKAAKEAAVETAAAQAKKVIDARVASAKSGSKLDTSPVELELPKVMSDDDAFREQLQATLKAVYDRAQIDAEIAVHLAKQQLLDEEDNVVLLLIS